MKNLRHRKIKDAINLVYTTYEGKVGKVIEPAEGTLRYYKNEADKEIEALSKPGLNSKGSQHYLIEHITNAVQLQTQREGLRKDKVNIKKLIMDYANKDISKNSNEGSEQSLLDVRNKLIAENKTKSTAQTSEETNGDLDTTIDDILKETKED